MFYYFKTKVQKLLAYEEPDTLAPRLRVVGVVQLTTKTSICSECATELFRESKT